MKVLVIQKLPQARGVQTSELSHFHDARTLPFQLDASPDALASEDLRLKYRYLDLRRPACNQISD